METSNIFTNNGLGAPSGDNQSKALLISHENSKQISNSEGTSSSCVGGGVDNCQQLSETGKKVPDTINVAQINLHHGRSPSYILGKKLASGEIDIALIQEPWTSDGKILGLGCSKDRLFYDRTCIRPRACIYASPKLNVMLMANFLSGDCVAVKLIFQKQGSLSEIIFSSCYLPYEDKDPLSYEAVSLIKYCLNRNLVIGCDANAHHIVWGSSDCNQRGDDLLDYILCYNLYILNKGNEPTFVTKKRREVIDITICNSTCYDHIKDWRVSDEITLSDHRLITFSVKGPLRQLTEGRNPRRTNWGSYKEDLKILTEGRFYKLSSVLDLELAVDQLQHAILQSYHQNCKATTTGLPRFVPWWSKGLSKLRSNCRRLFNKAKKNGNWHSYRDALTIYNKAVRKAKRESWRNFCDSINNTPAISRIVKIMKSDKGSSLNAIKLPDGGYTETGGDTLTEMFRVHFPGSVVTPDGDSNLTVNLRTCGRNKWEAAKGVVTYDKIIWAIKNFESYKSPGMDGIMPALLKEGIDILAPILCRIYRSCLALGHIPSAWRETKVIFIPKPGKDNYFDAKSFRPISLASFLLKALEKLIDRHIREVILVHKPLSQCQHAYQQGKSTDTALYNLTFTLNKCLNAKETALAVFLDIEGAFDKVPIDTILCALTEKGVNDTIVNWIKGFLTSRFVSSSLFGDTLRARTTVGCPQGGVLSPLLWCLVVDSLLKGVNQDGVDCIGYADDVVIVVKGKFPDTICSIMSDALHKVERWCSSRGLSVNPMKTTMVAFTRHRDIDLKDIIFFGQRLICSNDVKYLGVYFDSKLTWRRHLEYCINKAKRAFWSCRNAIGRTWGLKPKAIHWIHSMIIRPIISYGCIAWWSRTMIKSVRADLDKVQRMVCLAMSGCLRTTPTAPLEMFLGLCPLYMHIEAEALICMKRLTNLGHWKRYSSYLNWKDLNSDVIKHSHFSMHNDVMPCRFAFSKPYCIVFPTRGDWSVVPIPTDRNCTIWYTDGSKMNAGTGAGVCCPGDGTKFSYPLGGHTTVFQAEIFAILMCTHICFSRGYHSKQICICSDSQAALMALQKRRITSPLVWECYSMLCKLAVNNKMTLYWVPGHTGIHGNELADELARKGSATPFIGPEPVLGISVNLVRGTVYSIFKRKQYHDWLCAEGHRQTKELNATYPGNRATELLKLSRNAIRIAVGLLTGHCTLRRHLHIMKVINDPTCRGCRYEEESASHILCECPEFSALRFEHLGRHLIEPWELQNIPVRSLLNFISATGLLKG